jgi:hypothetical protein
LKLVISPMLLNDYLPHFSDVSQVQTSTPHHKRFSVTKRRPFPTSIWSRSQQKAFCKTYPALLVPQKRTIHRTVEKHEITGWARQK